MKRIALLVLMVAAFAGLSFGEEPAPVRTDALAARMQDLAAMHRCAAGAEPGSYMDRAVKRLIRVYQRDGKTEWVSQELARLQQIAEEASK